MNEDTRRIRDPRELPQSIPPSRDLWPSIEAQIAAEARGRTARTSVFASAGWRAAAGAAAAVVLLGVGIWIGRGTLGPGAGLAGGNAPPAMTARDSPAAPEHAGNGAQALPAAFAAGAAYSEERAALLRDVAAKIQALPPESRTKVEQSLAAVRRSIEELHAALGEDPSNVLLQELLVSAYQNEMRVLVTVQEAGRTGEEI